jgi:hypothetical protein
MDIYSLHIQYRTFNHACTVLWNIYIFYFNIWQLKPGLITGCYLVEAYIVIHTYTHRWPRLLKQKTMIIIYRLLTKENKFPFSIFRKQAEVCHFRSLLVPFSIYIYIDWNGISIHMLPFQTENGNRKPRRFSLILSPFAHHANESLLFVRFFMKKQPKLSIRKQTKRTKWTKQTKPTCPSMHT